MLSTHDPFARLHVPLKVLAVHLAVALRTRSCLVGALREIICNQLLLVGRGVL